MEMQQAVSRPIPVHAWAKAVGDVLNELGVSAEVVPEDDRNLAGWTKFAPDQGSKPEANTRPNMA